MKEKFKEVVDAILIAVVALFGVTLYVAAYIAESKPGRLLFVVLSALFIGLALLMLKKFIKK